MSELKLCKDCAYFHPATLWTPYVSPIPAMCSAPEAVREPLYGDVVQSALDLRIDQDACGAYAMWFVERPVELPRAPLWKRLFGVDA